MINKHDRMLGLSVAAWSYHHFAPGIDERLATLKHFGEAVARRRACDARRFGNNRLDLSCA